MEKKYLKEIDSGFTPLTICEEAARCLLCHDAPCSKECPAGTDPGKFIRSVRFRNFKGAAETIRINNILGAICARVCPTEKYCQHGCSRSGIDKPIDIGRIQRYVTDMEDALGMEVLEKAPANGKTIAVIGSGPAGLSIAGNLLCKGYDVTIYEKEAELGGYLRYGIPEYRLPNEIVDKEINRIIKLGLKVKVNTKVGKDVKVEDLQKEYDAVIMGIGYSVGKVIPMFKDNKYVETAVSYLRRIKENKGEVEVAKNVLVVGGGDVSMDICTSLKILGAENVTAVVYEELKEFKASTKELNNARENNVTIIDGYVPSEVNGNTVTFKHRFIPSEIKLTADKIVLAVGQTMDLEGINLEFEKGEATSKNYRVGDTNLFVCGDISKNPYKTVVGAVRSAKEAAFYVDQYLGGK